MTNPYNSDEIKNYLHYNQIKVKIAVAIVLIRKCKLAQENQNEFIAQIQSKFVKYWSEKEGNFESKDISNIQKRCLKDIAKNVLHINEGIKDPGGGTALINVIKKSLDIPEEFYLTVEHEHEDQETSHNCDFLRLIIGLKSLVNGGKESKFSEINNKNNVSTDFNDSGVDCWRSFNNSISSTTSFTPIPSLKIRSVIHSSDTNVATKVTLNKLLVYFQESIFDNAEDVTCYWKDSPGAMIINTIKILIREDVHVEIIANWISKLFLKIWNCHKTSEINIIPYQAFIISRLICNFNISTRLVEDLVNFIPIWCASIESIDHSNQTEKINNIITKGPLILDLISLIIKKWFIHLLNDVHIYKSKDSKTAQISNSIKDMWKSKWEISDNANLENERYKRYNRFIKIIRLDLIKFLKKINKQFPLMTPQIYYLIQLLNDCKSILVQKRS